MREKRIQLMAFLILVFFLQPMVLLANDLAEAHEYFNRGNTAYLEANYTQAIHFYERAAREFTSSPLHHNLANAYYRTGHVGPAVLHFERALFLNPGNVEAAGTLQHIRGLLSLTRPDRNLPQRVGERFRNGVLIAWGVALFWLAIACWAIPPLFRIDSPFMKFSGGMLLVAAGFFAWSLYGSHQLRHEVVILRDDTPLRVSPTQESPVTSRVHAGDILRITQVREPFVFLQNGDYSGWIEQEQIRVIRNLHEQVDPREESPDPESQEHSLPPESEDLRA